jgi:hypothetical protein
MYYITADDGELVLASEHLEDENLKLVSSSKPTCLNKS